MDRQARRRRIRRLSLFFLVLSAATTYSLAWWLLPDDRPWDRALSVAGLILTGGGFLLALGQIRAARSAAEVARDASEAARVTIRTGTLRQTLDLLVQFPDRFGLYHEGGRKGRQQLITDWLSAYRNVVQLLETSPHVRIEAREEAFAVFEQSKGIVLVCQEQLDRKRTAFSDPSINPLRRALQLAADAAATLRYTIEDSQVGVHGTA